MLKKMFFCATLLFSFNASAGWISADDFAVGDSITTLPGMNLSWISATPDQPETSAPVIVHDKSLDPDYYLPHKSFGGGAYIQNYANQVINPSGNELDDYFFLSIDFIDPIRSFDFKAYSNSGSPLTWLAYDRNGVYRQSGGSSGEGLSNPFRHFDYSVSANFDFDVGSIKIGSIGDVAYIYSVHIPEPSSVLLIFTALMSLLFIRKVKQGSPQKTIVYLK